MFVLKVTTPGFALCDDRRACLGGKFRAGSHQTARAYTGRWSTVEFVLLAFVIWLSTASNAASHETSDAESKRYVLNPHALPLGDGKVSNVPERGYVFSCNMDFRSGGAKHVGDWINGLTWDEGRKIYVQGNVAWADAMFSTSLSDGRRVIVGNALPTNHATGIFPIRSDDPAYQIDRNPNAITSQKLAWSLPVSPGFSSSPTCVPMGIVGVMLNGVSLFNALDAAGRDAVAHEVQDRCNGHPERRGQYHYHGPSKCIKGAMENNTLLGYAADGFGIYSMFDADGRELTNADLDECHGRTSIVQWDGRDVMMYHYVLTREYPYSVGCFRGVPSQRSDSIAARPGPPQEALHACGGLRAGDMCQFIGRREDVLRGTCQSPAGATVCVPQRP
jgi:hypothetical protein